MPEVDCIFCGTRNETAADAERGERSCWRCGNPLSAPLGDVSMFVGLVGGSAFGAAFWGPAGAVVGGVLGAILGKLTRGLG